MFTEYSAMEYLMIDVANSFGLDKITFPERIQWVKDNHKDLFKIADKADNFHLYTKSVLSLRKAIQTGHTNHMVALDACCSGTQLLSVMTGDVNAAYYVGLVDPDKRMDAYGELFNIMNDKLAVNDKLDPKMGRQALKDAFMTVWYQSTYQPIKIFGEDTPQLIAFYTAIQEMCAGPWAFLQAVKRVNFLDKTKTRHEWLMPDGSHIHLIARESMKARISVEELPTAGGSSSSFTHQYNVEQWHQHYKALGARIVHSADSYVLKEMIRRAKHDKRAVDYVLGLTSDAKITDNSAIVSAVEFDNIYSDKRRVNELSESQLAKLHRMGLMLIDQPNFDISTVHDSFKSLPQHCNSVRRNYNEVLAELAESNILSVIMSNLFQEHVQWTKFPNHQDLPNLIRNSNYALS